jgi:hypothetical protein
MERSMSSSSFKLWLLSNHNRSVLVARQSPIWIQRSSLRSLSKNLAECNEHTDFISQKSSVPKKSNGAAISDCDGLLPTFHLRIYSSIRWYAFMAVFLKLDLDFRQVVSDGSTSAVLYAQYAGTLPHGAIISLSLTQLNLDPSGIAHISNVEKFGPSSLN